MKKMLLISRSLCRTPAVFHFNKVLAPAAEVFVINANSKPAFDGEKRIHIGAGSASVEASAKEDNKLMGGRYRSGGGGGRFGGGYGGGGGGGNFRGNYDNYNDYGGNNNGMMNNMNPNLNNMNPNELLQIVNAMANNFNMNPPPPPPVRMNCGDLRAQHAGMVVELTGRLIKKRVARFAELRDRSGSATQMVISEDKFPRVARRLINMPENTTITVIGEVLLRPRNSCNQTMPTGEIEVEVQDIINMNFMSSVKRPGDKRSYSTMTQPNTSALSSTEYKMSKSDNILKYFENREMTCNDVRLEHINKTITLVGWIPSTKNNKFMQIKDGYGQTQIIIEDQTLRDTCLSAPEQTVVQVTGLVLARPRANINLKYDTGEVEVMVKSLRILNPDEPYDGPIKEKQKVQKMSIDDIDAEPAEGDAAEAKNGSSNEEGAKTKAVERPKIADTNKFSGRTHHCNELTSADINERVVLCGWLEYVRMDKFFILRDGYGQTQGLITDKAEGYEKFNAGIPLESVVRVTGKVIPRPHSTFNPKLKTGEIEIDTEKIEILNSASKNLPFEVKKFNRAGERLRLTHRYLDLRFTDMQHNLRMRSAVIMRMREYLINYLGFVEVETPTLFRCTPGGAQEFVVPTRKAGHFYSLVQSPQQFKQMLMAGAIDRYFQVARCYRDEATRPDRQPEFTQLDIELSFTTRDDILKLIEEVLRYCWPKEFPKVQIPFKRIKYEDAMEKYGTDKPDLRFGLTLANVTDIVQNNEKLAEEFKNMGAYALIVRAGEALMSSTARKHYEELGKDFAGKLFVRKFNTPSDLNERLNKLLTDPVAKELIDKHVLEVNDLLFLAIGEKNAARTLLGRIRIDYHNFLLENQNSKHSYKNAFAWIVDFPMFERDPETNELQSVHHPFTAPHEDDLAKFTEAKPEELENIRSQAYDLVLNGQEIGGGSIRIHDRAMQEYVLEHVLKIPTNHLTHLLNALDSGCPPHGGIALGLDRLLAIMCRARSIRDVIAFPKSLNGRDPLSSAPVPISDAEKALYHIAVVENDEELNTYEQEDDDPDVARKTPSPHPEDNGGDICMKEVEPKSETADVVIEEEVMVAPEKVEVKKETKPVTKTQSPQSKRLANKKK